MLWNALPLHPFRPGELESDRTPTDAEQMQGAPAMRMPVDAFPKKQKIVAIGHESELLLAEMGIATEDWLRCRGSNKCTLTQNSN